MKHNTKNTISLKQYNITTLHNQHKFVSQLITSFAQLLNTFDSCFAGHTQFKQCQTSLRHNSLQTLHNLKKERDFPLQNKSWCTLQLHNFVSWNHSTVHNLFVSQLIANFDFAQL